MFGHPADVVVIGFFDDADSAPARTFLAAATSEDAVAFAGSEAVERLCVTTNDLLAACRGTPTCAYAVLSQIEPHARFACVTVGVLAGTGLRANSLAELGYSGAALFR